MPLTGGEYNADRRQYVAESLTAAMEAHLPQLARDPNAVVIGITEEDMYIADLDWRFAFSYRNDRRFAVVSSARLVPLFNWIWPRSDVLEARTRKVVMKNVGLLVYGLPASDDPTSVLYRSINGLDDLDLVQERFDGVGRTAVVSPTVHMHGTPPAEPTFRVPPGSVTNANPLYPCLVMSPLTSSGSAGSAGSDPVHEEITQCVHGMRTEREYDELEIDLRVGL